MKLKSNPIPIMINSVTGETMNRLFEGGSNFENPQVTAINIRRELLTERKLSKLQQDIIEKQIIQLQKQEKRIEELESRLSNAICLIDDTVDGRGFGDK